jgi:hypothetical protein
MESASNYTKYFAIENANSTKHKTCSLRLYDVRDSSIGKVSDCGLENGEVGFPVLVAYCTDAGSEAH